MFLTLVFTTNPEIAHLIGEEVSYSSSHEGLIIYEPINKEELYHDESRVKTIVTTSPSLNEETDFVAVSISEQHTYIFMNTNLEYLRNKEGAEIS